MYRIREVDGRDDEVADTLADIHKLTFFDSACLPSFDQGHWWLAFQDVTPVAFAGVVPSTRARNAGYLSRRLQCLPLKESISPGGPTVIGPFSVFGTRYSCGIVCHMPVPYTDDDGGSHDVIEQDFHDQNAGNDHFCAGCRGHHENRKPALRF
jgi:hypothetical protein